MSRIACLARFLAAAVVGIGYILVTAGAVSAADNTQFYKGKRIKVLVGSSAGGGYDTYARMLARHMGRHIPGHPSFQVQDMPGAASVTTTNYMVNVAPKDGTVIGALQREIALIQLLGEPGPKFKAKDLQWLGSLASEAGVCGIATRTGIKSFEDVFTREFAMGGTGPNVSEFYPAMLNNLLGAKFKLIKGYPSTPPAHLAIERGEVDGICQSWASFKQQSGKFLTEGKIRPMVQMALKPDPEMTKMGVPMVFDFITSARMQPGFTTEDVKTYFSLVFASGVMGRPFAVAPGVPHDRVVTLRKALVETSKDPKFMAEATKSRRDVELVTGDEIQGIVEKMAATPKEKLAKLNSLMEFHGKTEKAVIKMVRNTGKVTASKKGGRQIVIDYKGKAAKAKISGSRTKVMIDGKKAKRSAIKVGMTCTFVYPGSGMQAQEVNCKR